MSSSDVVDLNVGGVSYSTTQGTLTRYPDSRLAKMFLGGGDLAKVMHNGKIFIDRDGVLFRYILDFLRNGKLSLPDNFLEKQRLKQEAEYYVIAEMVQSISGLWQVPAGRNGNNRPNLELQTQSAANGNAGSPGSSLLASPSVPIGGQPEAGTITIGYRGTFAFGRDGGMADVKFRKLLRILVAGRVSLCKEVFNDTLNESRDPDRGGNDRYTARFFLKHLFLEQAFDMLHEAGFRMIGSCGSGTNSAGDSKPGMDSEESKWLHYNEFVFCRP